MVCVVEEVGVKREHRNSAVTGRWFEVFSGWSSSTFEYVSGTNDVVNG